MNGQQPGAIIDGQVLQPPVPAPHGDAGSEECHSEQPSVEPDPSSVPGTRLPATYKSATMWCSIGESTNTAPCVWAMA